MFFLFGVIQEIVYGFADTVFFLESANLTFVFL